MNERKKILWLTTWYPNKYDLFDGDFIQRHARAAALYDDVHVIFVKPHLQQKTAESTITRTGGLTEEIIYFPALTGLLGKIKNYLTWKKLYKRHVKLFYTNGHPQLVHVHIPWKAGLIALWVKKKWGTPYIVTEHWGIYNNDVVDNINSRPPYVNNKLKNIFSGAENFISVSQYLGNAVNDLLVKKQFSVVPNVVDTDLFFYAEENAPTFTFLHVSNMVQLKNIKGLLQAFYDFTRQCPGNVQLILMGGEVEKHVQLAKDLGMHNSTVFFTGVKPYANVAAAMRNANVFVINSNIENSPCVISEALCTGLPVIATNVGGIPEMVTAENGVLVDRQNDRALQEAFQYVYENYLQYNRKAIAQTAQKTFSYPQIGKLHHQLYQKR